MKQPYVLEIHVNLRQGHPQGPMGQVVYSESVSIPGEFIDLIPLLSEFRKMALAQPSAAKVSTD